MGDCLYVGLTGEGKSDIGYVNVGTSEFVPGAMACVARALIDSYLPVRDVELKYDFISEHELNALVKASKLSRRQPSLSPRLSCEKSARPKFPRLLIRARVFGGYVKEKHPDEQTLCGIMFTDADGTRSSERGRWEGKFDAIKRGFEEMSFEKGVPMVPQPKSEAWLLGYYQKDFGKGYAAFQHCGRFEKLSGNDDSQPQNCAKTLLAKALKGRSVDLEEISSVRWEDMDMPSFNAFKRGLEKVVKCHKEIGNG